MKKCPSINMRLKVILISGKVTLGVIFSIFIAADRVNDEYDSFVLGFLLSYSY